MGNRLGVMMKRPSSFKSDATELEFGEFGEEDDLLGDSRKEIESIRMKDNLEEESAQGCEDRMDAVLEKLMRPMKQRDRSTSAAIIEIAENEFQVGVTVAQAAQKMAKGKLTCVIVLDDDSRVVGILTEQDLVRKVIAENYVGNRDIAEFMTKDPICLEVDGKFSADSFEAVLEIMAKHNFRHVPLVKAGTRLFAGCVDIVGATSAGDSASLAHMLSFPAGKMVRLQATLRGENERSSTEDTAPKNETFKGMGNLTAVDVAKFMATKKRSSVLIQDKNEILLGILTESDLVRKVLAISLPAEHALIHKIITQNPLTVSQDVNPFDALKIMLSRGFRHLPVVDNSGKVITTLDILALVKMSFTTFCQERGNEGDSRKGLWNHILRGGGDGRKGEQEASACSQIEPLDAILETNLEDEPSEESNKEGEKETQPIKIPEREREAVQLVIDGKFDEAIERLSAALADASHDPSTQARVYARRGQIRSCTGELHNAIKDLETGLEYAEGAGLEKIIKEASSGICEILIESGRYEEAAKRLDEYSLTDTQRRECTKQLDREVMKFKDLGKDLFVSRQFQDAIVAYTNAIRAQRCSLRPDHALQAILLSNRSACYQSIGDHNYTLQDALEATKLDPSFFKSWIRACISLKNLQKYKECIGLIAEAESSCPGQTRLNELKAECEGLLNKTRDEKREKIKGLGKLIDENLVMNH